MDCASDSHNRFRHQFGQLTEADITKLSKYVLLAREHWGTERGERHCEGIFHILYPWTYWFTYWKILRHEDAEEIANTALWRAWRTLQSYDDTKPFMPWFSRIVQNVARDHLRRHANTRTPKERRPVVVSFDAVAHDRAGRSESLDLRLDLEKWIAALPESLRPVFELRYQDERTVKEVASILGMSTRWVYQRLEMIREVLAPLYR